MKMSQNGLPYSEEERNAEISIVLDKQDAPSNFYASYALCFNSLEAGILFCHLWWWDQSDKTDNGGWFYRHSRDICKRTALNRYQQRTASQLLINLGVLQKKYLPIQQRTYFKINRQRFVELFNKFDLQQALDYASGKIEPGLKVDVGSATKESTGPSLKVDVGQAGPGLKVERDKGNIRKGNTFSKEKDKQPPVSIIPSTRKDSQLPPSFESSAEFLSTWEDFKSHYHSKTKKHLSPISIKRNLKILTQRSPADAIRLLDLAIRKNWQGLEWEWLDNTDKSKTSNRSATNIPNSTNQFVVPTKSLQKLFAGLTGKSKLESVLAQQLATLQEEAETWLDAHDANIVAQEKGRPYKAIQIWCRIIKDDFTAMQKKDPSIQLTLGWARNPKNDRWERALDEFSCYQNMDVRTGGEYLTAEEKIERREHYRKQEEADYNSEGSIRDRGRAKLHITKQQCWDANGKTLPRNQWLVQVDGVWQSLKQSQELLRELDAYVMRKGRDVE